MKFVLIVLNFIPRLSAWFALRYSLKATYNPNKGLLITATVSVYDGLDFQKETVKFRINQKTENVTIE